MNYSLEQLAKEIRKARNNKGLSQRALSAKIGVPQSHISKIENGMIDLRTSSLIELLRALDLELMLIPRVMVPTVQGIQKSITGGTSSQAMAPPPAYQINSENDDA